MTSRGRGDAPDNLGRYYTDPDVSRHIIRRCVLRGIIKPGDVVLEPSSGGGSFLDALAEFAPKADVYAMDVDPGASSMQTTGRRTYRSHLGDFLGPYPPDWPYPKTTVGNPPYSTKVEGERWQDAASLHARRAIEMSEHTIFELRMGFLGKPKGVDHPRRKFHGDYPPREIWPLWPRPSHTGGGTDSAEYAAIWWHRGYRGPTKWVPLEWWTP